MRTGIKPTPFQRKYEIVTRIQSYDLSFRGSNKQFSFLQVFLFYDKSDQHESIYDSYNVEIACTKIISLKLENAANTYTSKYLHLTALNLILTMNIINICFIVSLYRGIVKVLALNSPLTDYANDKIYKGLPRLDDFFTEPDEKRFIDLRRSKRYTNKLEKLSRDNSNVTLTVALKDAETQKMRLRVTGYYQGEYLYSLSNENHIINYI